MEPHESFAKEWELAKRAWRGPREVPIPERLEEMAEGELAPPKPEMAEKIPSLEEDYRRFKRLLGEVERRRAMEPRGFGTKLLDSLVRSWNGIYTNKARFLGLLLGLGLFWPLLAFGLRGFMGPRQATALLGLFGALGGLFVGSILVIIGLAYARGWSPEAPPEGEIKPRVDLERLKEVVAPKEVAEEISEKPMTLEELPGTETLRDSIGKFRESRGR